jgi:hypothetical protein
MCHFSQALCVPREIRTLALCVRPNRQSFLCLWPELNWHFRLRRPALYPLSYKGISGREPKILFRSADTAEKIKLRLSIKLWARTKAEDTGVEPVRDCSHWFSKPARYRPAHPPSVRLGRFERPIFGSATQCSIQLSYKRL